jgi:GNAT superfamily N-acetyltransferase
MTIRNAQVNDWQAIASLLGQLGYPVEEDLLKAKIALLCQQPNEALFVYERENHVVAFLSMHFIPQLGLTGDFARITYFAVDEAYRHTGIGKEMETYCADVARQRGCDRLELHCHARRTDAHRFYQRQGYVESPKYLMKMLSLDHPST